MIPHTFNEVRWSLSLLAVAVLALWRGGEPERIAITGVMVAHLITVIAPTLHGHRIVGPQWAILAANGESTVVSIYVLMRYRRWWPIASAGLKTISLLMYAAPLFAGPILPFAYAASSIVFDYLNLLTIALGTIVEGRAPLRGMAP